MQIKPCLIQKWTLMITCQGDIKGKICKNFLLASGNVSKYWGGVYVKLDPSWKRCPVKDFLNNSSSYLDKFRGKRRKLALFNLRNTIWVQLQHFSSFERKFLHNVSAIHNSSLSFTIYTLFFFLFSCTSLMWLIFSFHVQQNYEKQQERTLSQNKLLTL